MRVLGIVFAGTATDRRDEMSRFVADVLGLDRIEVEGATADMFALPDGSTFAVAGSREMGATSRSIGFLVDDLTAATASLRRAGIEPGPVAANDRYRYCHFTAPDGSLYELVEARSRATV